MFEDPAIADDGTAIGRLSVLLEATEHRWLPLVHTPLDVPGLYEAEGYGDNGFREELRDPWAGSRDQVGHLLTAVALAFRPTLVRARRFGVRSRDWVGAPEELEDAQVALRFAIGHEKEPDPGRYDPLMLLKVRRQYASASDADADAFLAALEALEGDVDLLLDRAAAILSEIDVGERDGNSPEDLCLTLVGYRLAHLIDTGRLQGGGEVASWIRRNLHARDHATQGIGAR
jgi:hypothetical protein